MKRQAILLLVSSAALLAMLVVLHWTTGSHPVRRPWLHPSIIPVLAITAVATTWQAWKRTDKPRFIYWLWPALFIGGGSGFLEGNPTTSISHHLMWWLAVWGACLGVEASGGLRAPGSPKRQERPT